MIKKAFDIVVDIVLIVCAMLLISKLILEIKTMIELVYPEDCIKINDNYYCKVRENTQNTVKM